MATRMGETENNFKELLLELVTAYKGDLLVFTRLPSAKRSLVTTENKSDKLGGYFTDLLFLLPFGVRRTIAHKALDAMMKTAVDNTFLISTIDGIEFVFGEICSICVHDQVDGNLFGSYASAKAEEHILKAENEGPFDWDEAMAEQTMMAKVSHLIDSPKSFPQERMEVIES